MIIVGRVKNILIISPHSHPSIAPYGMSDERWKDVCNNDQRKMLVISMNVVQDLRMSMSTGVPKRECNIFKSGD
jgi:hypothetical protein